MTHIRPARREDVPAILRFVKELAAFEREPDAVETDEAMLSHALFDERAAEAVIAERGGESVGFALFFHNFSTWTGKKGLYLEDLYVTPDARGDGVGTALLRHLAGIAVERGCGRFEWSVLDWNADAIALYRKMGAIGLGDWTVQRVSGEALAALAR
tara:strand:- start:489 stop:959 length:471 start_codon:yes stop_codon:yes gene_type:complete